MTVSFKDPNGVLDQAEHMDPVTRASFFECLERIGDPNQRPDEDPDVMDLRDPRYADGHTATFDDGILVYRGPYLLPPAPFIVLVDVVWTDESGEWAEWY